MSNFINKTSWKNIDRGYEFEAAMIYPSDTKRPLSFFIPDSSDPQKGVIHNSIGDFSPVASSDGGKRAIEQKVVMTIKPRRVVILSNNEINHEEEFEYILVAPINTIKTYEKTKDWYQKLINDQHPIFTYIPNGALDRYADLSQTISIHKSLLLRKLTEVTPERMEVIETNLLECLALGIVEDEHQMQ